MTVLAVVLSTHRTDNPDMVIDHELWLACMQAVSTVVGATCSEVLLEPRRGFFSWLSRGKLVSAGSIHDYMARLREGHDEDWQTVLWRNQTGLVAAATCERWYQVGGPDPYHDTYTTSIFLDKSAAVRLVPVLQVSVNRAGGLVEGMVDAPNAA